MFRRSPATRTTRAAREVFRLAPPVVLWWVWLAFVAANVADFAIQGAPGSSARFVTVVSAILATVTGLVYSLAFRPCVIVDQAGLMIVNPFRDHRVPWAAIQTVEVGDWVRVHYALGEDKDSPGLRSSDAPGLRSSAASRSISCWALYISARTKRKAARPPRLRSGWLRLSLPGGLGGETDYAGTSRLPKEARYLASLPPAKAIAAQLDTRAAKARARTGQVEPVTARWAWPPLVAVAGPALALLIIALI